MKRVLALAAVIAITGCTKKTTCAVEATAAKIGAVALSNALGCSAVDAIEEDAKEQISKLNLCGKTGLANRTAGLCEAVGNMVLDGLVTTIPAKWKCNGGLTVEAAKSLLIAKCAGSSL